VNFHLIVITMNTSNNPAMSVIFLQRTLALDDPHLQVDGLPGRETRSALRRFQQQRGLPVTGTVCGETDRLLAQAARSAGLLTDPDIAEVSEALGVPPTRLLALVDVESAGCGFLPDGRAKLLFERHVMYRRLVAAALPAERWRSEFPEIVNTAPGGYLGGAREYERFDAATELDRACAIEASSWGLFQIMGLHWSELAYASAVDFAASMISDERGQLDAFVRFIERDAMLQRALQQRRWDDFARRYNGPAYRTHGYATRLAAADAHFAALLEGGAA
jgi:N-acetylmuramidase/Putative peptidoglycan binding domain